MNDSVNKDVQHYYGEVLQDPSDFSTHYGFFDCAVDVGVNTGNGACC